MYLLLIAALLLWAPPRQALAQTPDADPQVERLQQAFSAGDARLILAEARDRIELSIFGNSTLYTRSQATYVLQEFFRAHPPEGSVFYDISHAGDSRFATGQLRIKQQEQPLRVFVRLRAFEEEWVLREIRVGRTE